MLLNGGDSDAISDTASPLRMSRTSDFGVRLEARLLEEAFRPLAGSPPILALDPEKGFFSIFSSFSRLGMKGHAHD